MLSRRTLLKAAGGTALIAWDIGNASAAVLEQMGAPGMLVVDIRHASGSRLASVARGSTLLATEGDPTLLWTRHLLPLWRDQAPGTPVAGVTTASTLFCLDQMARDHGMRVVAMEAASGCVAAAGCPLCPLPDVTSLDPDGAASRLVRALAGSIGRRVELSEPVFAWVIAPISVS